MKSQIGEQIKQYRIKAGLTQNEVSEALGIHRSTYARQEAQGKISPDLAPKLAALFHVSPVQILYGEQETDMPMETYLHGNSPRSFEPITLNSSGPQFLTSKPLVLTNNERNYIRIFRKLNRQQLKKLEQFLMDLQNEN